MDIFLSGMDAAWQFLLQVGTAVFSMYITYPILMAAFTLWILDRVFGIFDLIKG